MAEKDERFFSKDGKEKSEARIQQEIVLYLQAHGIFCHSVPNEGAGGDALRSSRLVAMGMRAGVADLVVWYPTPMGVEVGYLEIKDRKGKQSAKQMAFEEKCKVAGIPYNLVRSTEEVGELLKRKREGVSNDSGREAWDSGKA